MTTNLHREAEPPTHHSHPRRRASGRPAWVVRCAIAVVVAAVGATTWLMVSPHTYTATSSVYVKSSRSDAGAVFAQGAYEQNRVQSFAALAHSTLVTTLAAERAAVPISAADLSDEVSVQVLPQTVIIAITVEDREPVRARDLSVALAETVAEQGNAIESAGSQGTSPVNLVVLDEADIPRRAASPQTLRIVVLCALMGALAGIAVPLPRRRSGKPSIEPGVAPDAPSRGRE